MSNNIRRVLPPPPLYRQSPVAFMEPLGQGAPQLLFMRRVFNWNWLLIGEASDKIKNLKGNSDVSKELKGLESERKVRVAHTTF